MIGWYIVPYVVQGTGLYNLIRYCAMDDYTPQIHGAGGWWVESEVLGDRAIVKVRATPEVLTVLDGVFKRLPKDRLDDSLSDLSVAVRKALKDEMLDMGYASAEIQAAFPGDLRDYTLGDVLRFMATRRRDTRWDEPSQSVVLDGPERSCKPIESVDAEVVE